MASVVTLLTQEIVNTRVAGKELPQDNRLAIALRVVIDTMHGIILLPNEWKKHEEHVGVALNYLGMTEGDVAGSPHLLEHMVGGMVCITKKGVSGLYVGGTSIEMMLARNGVRHLPETLERAKKLLEKFVVKGEIPLSPQYTAKAFP